MDPTIGPKIGPGRILIKPEALLRDIEYGFYVEAVRMRARRLGLKSKCRSVSKSHVVMEGGTSPWEKIKVLSDNAAMRNRTY